MRGQLEVVRKELGEVNQKLLAANTKVDELTKELEDMHSTEQLEADDEDVKNKKTREEELVKEVGDKKSRVEELEKEVDVLETPGLEVFYDFWKANPKGNFDYLGDSKDMYLNFCAAQAAKENLKATTSTAPTDQSAEVPTVQDDDPPAPSDRIDPYQEHGTPAL
uniref:Uncharacterized protein n=1 Tax=Cannabis sativa TaxID=3483 RepID=A0A803P679_CANSA